MREEIRQATEVICNLLKLVIDSDDTVGSTSKAYQKAYSVQNTLINQMNQAIKQLAILLPEEK